jgi:two-component system phosphate regulon sensor histidine kinase PhoR
VTLSGELPSEPLPLVSDPDRVESILVNLVQNAVRYTPRGGAVTVAVEAAPQGASYRVRDTGIGIPPKDLPRVTERFYRVDPGRSRAQGGTGLGLSIVKHLVELLRGNLRIESEHGRGTAVTVVVPNLRRG